MRAVRRKLSAGPDSQLSSFWVKLFSSLCLPASIIYIYSYKFSVLHSNWKCAGVAPLLKNNDPCFVTNYRPISLPSIHCKVMESIVKNNLLDFAQSLKILDANQHDLTSGKSTSTRVLECL